MRQERAGKGASPGSKQGGTMGASPATGNIIKAMRNEEPLLDARKAVKQWRNGRRKQAHDVLAKIITSNPSPLAFTGRTWLLYMEWDELRGKAGRDLVKVEEQSKAVKQAAQDGVKFRPASITCAEISLTCQMQLLEAFTRDDVDVDAKKVDNLKQIVVEECIQYLQMDIGDWVDPADEVYPGMQGADQRVTQTPKHRLLAKLEKFREYKNRAKPSMPRTYHGLSGLDKSAGIHNMQHFRDAAIDKKLEKLRTEVNVEAMAVRREDNGASRSSNPKLMQQYLHHNAMQGEQQSEVAAQGQTIRRGRGGRGRSGAVEEGRLEQTRTKKENKEKAAREEKLRQGAKTREFLRQILPQDKEDRISRFLELLTVNLDALKSKVLRMRERDTRERLKTHLEHLESYGSWHFYSSLASQFAPDVCFHTTQELHKYLEQKQLQELEPLNLAFHCSQLYQGSEICCQLNKDEPLARMGAVPSFTAIEKALDQQAENLEEATELTQDIESGALDIKREPEDAPETEVVEMDTSCDMEGIQVELQGSEGDLHTSGLTQDLSGVVWLTGKESLLSNEATAWGLTVDHSTRVRTLLAFKQMQNVRDPLQWYTNHFMEHLNMQDAAEEIHDLRGEEISPYVRHWNNSDVAYFSQSGFWTPRNMSQEQLDNSMSVGEQLLNLSRCLKKQQNLKEAQEAEEDLNPDKAVELQGKMQETEQEIQLAIMRLKGLGGVEEQAVPVNSSDGSRSPENPMPTALSWPVSMPARKDMAGDAELQFRPEYMRSSREFARNASGGSSDMALTGNGSYERLADMEDEHDLQRKQQLISDIWQALHILQDNQLLSTQLLETISNFTKDRCARLEGPNLDAEGPEALQNMGFLPRDDLEALRAFCLQQLGMRGRVLDVFYVTSQTQEETELRLGIGFEKDSSTDDGNTPCLRFTLTHYDFIRQTIADQKQEASERGQLLGQRRGADSNEGITVGSEPDLEGEVEATILEELYTTLASDDTSPNDPRSHQFAADLKCCQQSLNNLRNDLDARTGMLQTAREVEMEMIKLNPHVHLLMQNSAEAAKQMEKTIMDIVRALIVHDETLGGELWRWNSARFHERIQFHNTELQELEQQIQDINRETQEIQNAQLVDRNGNRVQGVMPSEMQQHFLALSQERELIFQRHNNHNRHKTNATQHLQYFRQSFSKYASAAEDPDSARMQHHDYEEAAKTYEFPDPTGTLPGFIRTMHDGVLDKLAMLRLVAADIGIRAEALLVKARQCVVQCINHSFHRPPAQLLNCIKELACERLEKAMKDQQAKDAKESEEKLLLELEAESSKPRKEDKEKDKRKKGKSKSKKGKKPGGAATYKPGEQPGTEHQEDEEVPREDAALDDSLAEMDEVEEDKQLAAVFPAPFSSASSVIASDMSVRFSSSICLEDSSAAPHDVLVDEYFESENSEWETAGRRMRRPQSRSELATEEAAQSTCAAASPAKEDPATSPPPPAPRDVPIQQASVPALHTKPSDCEAEPAAEESLPSLPSPAHEPAPQILLKRAEQQQEAAEKAREPPNGRRPNGAVSAHHQPEAPVRPPPREPIPGQTFDDVEKTKQKKRRSSKHKKKEAGAAMAASGSPSPGAATPPGRTPPGPPPATQPAASAPTAPALVLVQPVPVHPADAASAAASWQQQQQLQMQQFQHQHMQHLHQAHHQYGMMIPPGLSMQGMIPLPHGAVPHGAIVTPLPGAMGISPHMVHPPPPPHAPHTPHGMPYAMPFHQASTGTYLPPHMAMGMPPHPMQPHQMSPLPPGAPPPSIPYGMPIPGAMAMGISPQPYTPPPAPPPAQHPPSAKGRQESLGAVTRSASQESGHKPAAPARIKAGREADVAGLLNMLNSKGEGQQNGAVSDPTPAEAQQKEQEQQLRLQNPKSLEDQEQADLDAAIAASLQDAPRDPQEDSWRGSSGDLASAVVAEGLPQLARLENSEITAGVGLMNGIGEYNCFLNVIIQCLWHLTNFRHAMLGGDPQVHEANDVIRALYNLFQSFHQVDRQRKEQKGNGTDKADSPSEGTKHVVSPTELREALSAVEGQQIFRLGEMNDAGEVLAVLWSCMHDAHEQAYKRHERSSKPWKSLALVDEMFGLEVHEVMACSRCKKETRKADYLQYRQTVPAMALRLQAALEPDVSMGSLVYAVMRSHMLPCDPDEGGCGTQNTMALNLRRPPGVLTIELAWATERAPADDIKATLGAVDDIVDLGEIYSGLGLGMHIYKLRSMVCYYGAHYQAFVLSPDLGKWLIFDDESITVIGSWESVKAKCLAGRIQPSVLFYEQQQQQQQRPK